MSNHSGHGVYIDNPNVIVKAIVSLLGVNIRRALISLKVAQRLNQKIVFLLLSKEERNNYKIEV
jgi:hypothetical protein